jgi:hypothetical protein
MPNKIYNVEAKGTIRICMDVHASSQEEAEALADQVKEIKYGDESILLDPWKPLYDSFDLEITSVQPEPDRSCMRPFIPDFDD